MAEFIYKELQKIDKGLKRQVDELLSKDESVSECFENAEILGRQHLTNQLKKMRDEYSKRCEDGNVIEETIIAIRFGQEMAETMTGTLKDEFPTIDTDSVLAVLVCMFLAEVDREVVNAYGRGDLG